ncbi:nitronate monooxygenase [Patescibacteria group bacterium]|nr:nitronate monooxygenase [Patescibacteria group bacterium]MBU1124079.1 nitronate monooxygenase [Patescibacteria group bacterium]MBU1911424.1 nitronate monooxygenase [Patescibacteria group bacterium]
MPSLREQLSVPEFHSEAQKQEYLQALFNGEVKVLMSGGMGAGFTEENFCGAMSEAGHIGTYSAAIPGWRLGQEAQEFQTVGNLRERNAEAIERASNYLRERYEFAVKNSNFMELLPSYKQSRGEVVRNGAFDILSVGAGMDSELPADMAEANAELQKEEPKRTLRYMPIVSSVLAAKIYHKKYANSGNSPDSLRPPDGYYLELPIDKRGNTAGGHLGAKKTKDPNPDDFDPEVILAGIRKFDETSPVILAGGIAYRDQIKAALDMGFAGVSMGTRYLLTQESGMSNERIKDMYLNPDVGMLLDQNSPTGYWSSRLDVPHTERTIELIREAIGGCVDCVGDICEFRSNWKDTEDTHYCIYRDLIKARLGKEVGIYFSGGQIIVMRHDDRYRNDGQIYIPTVEEITEYSLTHDAPE